MRNCFLASACLLLSFLALASNEKRILILSPGSLSADQICFYFKETIVSQLNNVTFEQYTFHQNHNASAIHTIACKALPRKHHAALTVGSLCTAQLLQAAKEFQLRLPIIFAGGEATAINQKSYPITGVTESAQFEKHFQALSENTKVQKLILIYSTENNLRQPTRVGEWQAVAAKNNTPFEALMIESEEELEQKVPAALACAGTVLVLKDHWMCHRIKKLFDICRRQSIDICTSDEGTFQLMQSKHCLAYGVSNRAFANNAAALMIKILTQQADPSSLPIVDLTDQARLIEKRQ